MTEPLDPEPEYRTLRDWAEQFGLDDHDLAILLAAHPDVGLGDALTLDHLNDLYGLAVRPADRKDDPDAHAL